MCGARPVRRNRKSRATRPDGTILVYSQPPPIVPRVTQRLAAIAFLVSSTLGVAGVRAADGLAHFSDPASEVRVLVDLMERRLALMPEVAAWKHARGQPVTDAAREREVLDRWEDAAAGFGIERGAARGFMDAQIAAARELQERLRADWEGGLAVPPSARDLAGAIRPELDRIGAEMLAAVNAVASNGELAASSTRAREALQALRAGGRISVERAEQLGTALVALRRTAPAELSALRPSSAVRVGLTGDYAPFCEERGGVLEGVDVDLVRQFAAELGLNVAFVRTSWTRLMADLADGRFDFAVGGISVTPERSRVADFGPEYFWDGKMPIARRAERERFGSLEAIDQPGVRVIVNPGGTNERFARENLRRAEIRVFPDNRAIFGEILAGRADVMITDGIEVRLQVSRNPGLCETRPEPFTRSGKAWLFPRGAGLASEAERWLTPRVKAGEVARRIEAAIAAGR